MTRFDPFAFGQVELNTDKAAPSASPDDLLFTEGVGSARNAPPADSSWGLIDADVDSLLPGAKATAGGLDFGAEVLGEVAHEEPAVAAPVRARPAAVPRPASAPAPGKSTTARPRTSDGQRREVGARPLSAPAAASAAAVVATESPAPAPTYVARKPSSVGRMGRPGPMAIVLPALLFCGGGATSAWLYAMQQHTIMAVIVGALTLVATGFLRTLLRG